MPRLELGFEEWLAERPAEKVLSTYESKYAGEGFPCYSTAENEWIFWVLPTGQWGNNNIGIFSGSANSFSSLGKLLGLEGTNSTKHLLLASLDKAIAKESNELTKVLSRALKEAGLEDVTKKITFAEDEKGNIVIEGNISAKQKKKLAKLINENPKLVEQIKTQKARMEIAEELRNDGRFIDDEGKFTTKDTGKTYKANLSDKKFDAARTQLLKSFLSKNDFALENLADEDNTQLNELLESFPELKTEIKAYLDRQNEEGEEESSALRPLLAMKRGVLSEAVVVDETELLMDGMKLRKTIYEEIVTEYNKLYKDHPDAQIFKFDMKFDHKGRLKITNVETSGNDPKENEIAQRAMNSWLSEEMVQDGRALGLAMLDKHDDEHGDVQEFKHEVVFSAFGGYQVLSPDADRAAMEELEGLTQELGAVLGNFFGNTLGIENPFELVFGADGKLSFGAHSLLSMESDKIQEVLDAVNEYFAAEEAGEDTEEMLSGELVGIAERLVALKEVAGKIHDKSLLPEKGFRFTL
jgi:hypothetical protein